jgi:predicted O-methyltransferase YrrM
MGFFAIPTFGITIPSIIIGVLIGTLPFVLLLSHKKYIALLFVAFLILSFSQSKKTTASSDLKVLEFSEGLLGQVVVADVFKNGIGQPTNDRVLFVNRMGQTLVNLNTHSSPWNYITFSSAIASKLPEHSKALVLGLGGGSVANILYNKLQFNVDAVELDARIAEIAEKYFSLNGNINVIVDDARHFLETTRNNYDLIFFDVFKGDIPPAHVLSLECFEKAKTLLNPDGMIIVNFNGFLTGETGKPGRCLFSTLLAANFNTKILLTPGTEEERNTLFLASIEPKTFQQVRSPLLFKGTPVLIDTLFLNTNSLNLSDAIVLTDDKPNLEKMNQAAGNLWRREYNSSFTRFFLENGVPLFE